MQERRACAWLVEFLKANGFTVTKGVAGMPTAFRGIYGKGKPAIAFLAEYDALPKIGHACGHNLIATSAVAAGIAAKLAVDKYRRQHRCFWHACRRRSMPVRLSWRKRAFLMDLMCYDDPSR